jgi:ferrous iron transport protein B
MSTFDQHSTPVISLVGNPNCGKTTLFNQLTGASQRVGNWPGVTVEKKSGSCQFNQHTFEIIDLPGTYSIIADKSGESLDETITQNFISGQNSDLIINVLDASSLERGLYLTSQLFDAQTPMIIALNMVDVAEKQSIKIDHKALSKKLGVPVIPIMASKATGNQYLLTAALNTLEKHTIANRPFSYDAATQSQLNEKTEKSQLERLSRIEQTMSANGSSTLITSRYEWIDQLCDEFLCKNQTPKKTMGQYIDDVVLNRFLAFPIFLGVMYLLFMFSINIGSAFIDFFDISAGAIFVETPRWLLTSVGSPEWLTTFVADGIGGGVQLVASFIPVIAALFLALSFLEDVGYMARAAFIIDRLMRTLGLPGKAFVPLIIGFGCNVPAVMAARTLNKEGDRLVTTLMAPFMSCGARLTVYALFASAFFVENGEDVVFLLYLTGILVAVLTAFLVRRFILPNSENSSIMALPPYLLPTSRNLIMHTWHRLKGFVMRAGKAIIVVVMVLNVLNSMGTDGSFGNENKEHSVLSEVGKFITPAFSPMGIDEDNWPATVGIFTGLFAKEVVVGTLDALYTQQDSSGEDFNFLDSMSDALLSIQNNLTDAIASYDDPLGLGLGDLNDSGSVAEQQGISISTISAIENSFHGQWGAFVYLLFILLYMPCVATIGAIIKEHGHYWAGFSMVWSLSLSYVLAVVIYQASIYSQQPNHSLAWIIGLSIWQILMTVVLFKSGKQQAVKENLIPALNLD